MGEWKAVPNCYIAEFVGTFMLIATVGCNVLAGSPVWAATSIACVLMVCIYALGGVSGANFNPAVSLALGVADKMDPTDTANNWKQVGIYTAVQLIAGIAAGFFYFLLLGDTFNLAPAEGFEWWQVCLAEGIYTFMLCFVVLNVACSKGNAGTQFYGLAIGFVIIAGGYAVGHMGAGCFNPAVALGIDVSSAHLGFGWCFVYWAAEFVGAAIAALLFKFCRQEEYDEQITAVNRSLPPKLCSEFLGTYILVLTVGLNVLGASPAAVWSIAASLMCMIFALGGVSGAHFNPAVTVAIACSHPKKVAEDAVNHGAYIVTQLVAGVCAAMTYVVLENGHSFPLAPSPKYGLGPALASEFLFTFLLAFVVLSVATIKGVLSEFFALAIASCVTVGGYAIGGVSGGSLNPAVTTGITMSHLAVKGDSSMIMNCLSYSAVELLGGAFAAGVFYATRMNTEDYPEGDEAADVEKAK